MNLSEKLNYCNTDILLEGYHKHLELAKSYKEQFPNAELNIWQTAESPYYKVLMELKKKQDAGEVITDEEYKSLPIGGIPDFYSVYYYYYTVNFHYNFHNPKFVDKTTLVYRFLEFLEEIDFSKCSQSETLNELASFNYFVANFINDTSLDTKLNDICEFISDILDAVNPLNGYGVGILINIDKNISPKLFNNVFKYLSSTTPTMDGLKKQYIKTTSLKAKDVMNILNITRQTLCKYVKEGKVKINSNINGKYTYDKESVFKLINRGK